MNIKIYYCGVWNYLEQASRLEEELKSKFSDIAITLIEGKGGIFKVLLEDEIIFDKSILKEFPKDNEISQILFSL